jgi:putative ABC transport system permease protein
VAAPPPGGEARPPVIRVALRMLLGDRLKYAGLVAGLAFAAFLITQQASIYAGFTSRVGSWLRDTGQADLWIMDPEVEFTEDRKPMGDTELLRVRGVDGVAWAVPVFKSYVNCRLMDGTRVLVRMIGIDDATLMGGPPRMVEGTLGSLKQDRGVLVDVRDVDDALRLARGLSGAEPRALAVGDRIDVNDHEAVVVGTFARTREFFWDAVIFTTYSRALSWAPPERHALSYVMAKVEPGTDPAEVAARIERTTGLQALTSAGFEALSRKFILQQTGIQANFGITIALGFVIGVLVSGQLLYNFVLDNSRAFASMKAMGATGGVLMRMVSVQVAFAASTGFGLGVGAAAISGRLLANTDLAFHMVWQVPVFGGLAIFVCSLLAALLSIARVLALEPATVFKG